MTCESRFNAVAENPVTRLMHVHAASLASAARRHDQAAGAAFCPASDRRSCRVALNALRREIDRLRRGFDRVDLSRRAIVRGGEGPGALTRPTDDGSLRSPQRKAYAPYPVGEIAPARADEPAPAPAPTVENYFRTTNLGTLLDRLA